MTPCISSVRLVQRFRFHLDASVLVTLSLYLWEMLTVVVQRQPLSLFHG